MPQGVTVEQMLLAMSQQDIEPEPEPQPEAVKPARKRPAAPEAES
jgi:hypothetical protein